MWCFGTMHLGVGHHCQRCVRCTSFGFESGTLTWFFSFAWHLARSQCCASYYILVLQFLHFVTYVFGLHCCISLWHGYSFALAIALPLSFGFFLHIMTCYILVLCVSLHLCFVILYLCILCFWLILMCIVVALMLFCSYCYIGILSFLVSLILHHPTVSRCYSRYCILSLQLSLHFVTTSTFILSHFVCCIIVFVFWLTLQLFSCLHHH
jgi:hypothetical protein